MEKNSKDKRKPVIDFNYISSKLSYTEKNMLKKYYSYYFKQEYVYRKSYKLYNAVNIALNTISALLVSSSIVAVLTAPIAAVIAAGAIITTGINEGLKFKSKAETCLKVANFYKEILIDIRSYLRGDEFNTEQLIDELRIKEQLINSITCLPVNYYIKKFEKKYCV